jgi:hypothetical protein
MLYDSPVPADTSVKTVVLVVLLKCITVWTVPYCSYCGFSTITAIAVVTAALVKIILGDLHQPFLLLVHNFSSVKLYDSPVPADTSVKNVVLVVLLNV